MPDAREAALAAMTVAPCRLYTSIPRRLSSTGPAPANYVTHCTHRSCALDALASSPEVREALADAICLANTHAGLDGPCLNCVEEVAEVMDALAGTSETEAG